MSDIAQLAPTAPTPPTPPGPPTAAGDDAAAPSDDVADRAARVLASFWSLPQANADIVQAAATRIATDMPSAQTLLSARVRPHAGRPSAFLKMVDRPTGYHAEHYGLMTGRTAGPACLPIRVPEVLHTVPTEHALLIEYVGGIRLSHFLQRRYLALPPWTVSLVGDLGRWFADFHAATREVGSSEEFAKGHSEVIRDNLRRATERGRLSSQESDTVHRLADAIAGVVASRPLSLAWCHADVSLNNILIHRRTLYVIDFAKSGVHPPERDQLGFWNSLKKDVGHLPFSGRVRRKLWRAFKDGYEEAASTPTNIGVRDLLHLEDMLHELAWGPDPGAPVSAAALRRKRLFGLLKRHLHRWTSEHVRTYGVDTGSPT
jgi:tRNA A-37 threonylcarbamoyl transferase component Bud32